MLTLDHEKTLKDAIARELSAFLLGVVKPESVRITVYFPCSIATLRIEEEELDRIYGEVAGNG